MRIALLFFFAIGGVQALAQGNIYRFDLQLNPEQKTIEGVCDFTFVNSTGLSLDTLIIHLPPRSLESRKSFLTQQFAEFQDVDLYYADREEKGFITIDSLQVGDNKQRPLCENCEFGRLPLTSPLHPGDSIHISFQFTIKLPESHWIGVGYDEHTIRIIDWLPQFATMDSAGFHPYPVTWQRDVFPSVNNYKVNLTLPDSFLVASNAKLLTTSEIKRLNSLKSNPYQKSTSKPSTKTLEYSHRGTNLQFVLSSRFYVFPMQNGGTLYTVSDDPFIPAIADTLNERTTRFFKDELGEDPLPDYDLLLIDDKVTEYQSDRLLTLPYPKNAFDMAKSLVQAKAEAVFRYRITPNGFKHVWLARGIPYFYKYEFIKEYYPEENWLPFSSSLVGKIFSLDEFDYGYQNQFLYLFLARQGVDQKIASPADSLTRLNYEGVAQAKTYLALNHFRNYTSATHFKRAMRHYWLNNNNSWQSSPADLRESFEYFVNRDVGWFFEDWVHSNEIYDYRLQKFEHCPTVSTATVQNRGELTIPYSLTGFKDGKPVLTEWFEGHDTTRTVQIYHEDYDQVILNYEERNGEFDQKNNTYYNRALFPRMEILHLQFYKSFEDPRHTQLFWLPTVGYNAYDQVLLGISLYNDGLVPRKWQYALGPEYSTGQGQLTGYGSLTYNLIPDGLPIFNRITAGLYGRYYHYNQGLAYYRLSPGINFYFQKPFARSTVLQRFRIRSVHVERELDNTFEGVANQVSNASYSVLNLTYTYEETNIFKPYTLRSDFMLGDQFSRLSVTGDFRWMLPNKRWLIWRNFAGVFLSNRFAQTGLDKNYYSLGLSGTQDFLFDYNFIGRSDESGIWSRQFFITDGGFKSATGVFADQFLLSTNLNIPLWKFIGVFGDVGVADDFKTVYNDYGIRLALLTDFAEVYIPIGNHTGIFPINEYGDHIRFVLDLDVSNIIHRLRRGYY